MYQICHLRSFLAERGDSCNGQSRRDPRYWYSSFPLSLPSPLENACNRNSSTVYSTNLTYIYLLLCTDGYTSHNISRSLQDTLICFEMFLVSFAHLYTFSYKPFTEGGKMEKRSLAFKDRDSHSLEGPLIPFPVSLSTEPLPFREKYKQQTQKGKRDFEKFVDKDRGKVACVAALYIPPNQTKDSRPRFATGRMARPGTAADATSSLPSAGDRLHMNIAKGQRQGEGQRGSSTLMGMLDRNFASNAAVRDFNDSMPIVVPSNFSPENGIVAVSRPSDRVTDWFSHWISRMYKGKGDEAEEGEGGQFCTLYIRPVDCMTI